MESVSINECVEPTPYVMKGDFTKKALDIYHLILAPSYACNLACTHCYLPNHSSLTLPYKQVESLVDQFSEIVQEERGVFGGIFHLKGGEPLSLPYLGDILDYLSKKRTLQFREELGSGLTIGHKGESALDRYPIVKPDNHLKGPPRRLNH